jgi:hypothetical protein
MQIQLYDLELIFLLFILFFCTNVNLCVRIQLFFLHFSAKNVVLR